MTKLFKIKEKIKISQEIQMILREIAVFAIAFLIMQVRFIFDTYPFGLAYVCAQKKYTPFAFCGCILSVFFLMGADMTYLIALCGLLGLRIVASLLQKNDKARVLLGETPKNNTLESLFCENTEVRVAICAFCGFGIGVFRAVSNKYSYYEIYVLVFLTILCGILTYALSLTSKRCLSVSLATVFFMLLYAVRSVEIFSLNLSLVIGYALVLYTSRYLGSIKACALGLALGLCQPLGFTPVLAIGGMISGLIWTTSPYLAIMSALALSLGYGIYEGGYVALTSTFPELLLVSLVMYPLLRFKMIPVPEFIKENAKGEKSMDTVLLKRCEQSDRERLSMLTDTFDNVSNLIKEASERIKTPSRMDYCALCLEAVESYCHNCPKNSICWEKNITVTESNVSKLGEELFSEGEVSLSGLDERFLHRCPNIENIVKKINHISKDNLSSIVKNNKLEIASCDYDQISKLLLSTQDDKSNEEFDDVHSGDKLTSALAKINLDFADVRVMGRRRKQVLVTGINIERSKCTKEQLKSTIEKALSSPVSELSLTAEGNIATLYAATLGIYKVTEIWESQTKEGESENGDSIISFDSISSMHYAILCDGMGSGRDAGITSNMCAQFLKSILSVSNQKEIALSMLNSLIRARGLESSSTIDLLEIDLITGKGSFVKCGAAPSYIKRGDKVFQLESRTMPIGILKDLDAEVLSFELQDGDVCIMLSDGIVETKEDGEEIMKLLRAHTDSVDTLPQKILALAKKRKESNDDMTVLVTSLLCTR